MSLRRDLFLTSLHGDPVKKTWLFFWSFHANSSDAPLVLEGPTAEEALATFRKHSLYSDAFWKEAFICVAPADGALIINPKA